MTRHVVTGVFGADDHPVIHEDQAFQYSYLMLVERDHELALGLAKVLDDLAVLCVYPSELGFDVLMVATHVYAADTRISRTTESQDGWAREVDVVVPVSDPDRWSQVAPLLKRMADFLTGDRWTFVFRERPDRFRTVVQDRPQAAPMPEYDHLSLFSGGLDSLIGTIDAMENGRQPLLVSHWGEGSTSEPQTNLLEGLRRHYAGRKVDRVALRMIPPSTLVQDVPSESTTRGRSFLFFALGVLAGTGLGRPFTLQAPENGLIALNVPLDLLRLGALSTRTTHPFYIARWNELLERLGIAGRIENPYWRRTKGEMVAECAGHPVLGDLAASSMSCSSPTKGRWQRHTIAHCGYCLPCIIRRAALRSGIEGMPDPTIYRESLTARVLNTKTAIGRQARSFQYAINRLNSQPGIETALIHKPGPLTDCPERWQELAAVYTRGMQEVSMTLAQVRTAAL